MSSPYTSTFTLQGSQPYILTAEAPQAFKPNKTEWVPVFGNENTLQQWSICEESYIPNTLVTEKRLCTRCQEIYKIKERQINYRNR
jgi:hypothetical protein